MEGALTIKISESELALRRQRIMDTAFILFCRHGIEKVTLSEIAAQSGVGDSTIYRYFGSKPLLVRDTLSVLWKSIGEQLESMSVTAAHYKELTGYEQLAIRLDSFRRLYLNNADYILFSYEAKLYLQRNGIQLSKEEFDGLMEEIKDPCISTLHKGKADGTISPVEDSEDMFYAIWGAVRGYVVKIVIYRELCQEYSPWEKRFGLLIRGILRAVSTDFDYTRCSLDLDAMFRP